MANLSFNPQEGVIRATSEESPSHYTLKIESLSLMTKNNIERYESNRFEAGGYKWKLVIYPNGNKNKNIKDYVSFYLLTAEESSVRGGWEVHAVFRLFLLDQNKDNYLTLQDPSTKGRRFHEMKLMWGFDKFIPLATFSDPSNGYLVNDTCVFGAEIFVCREKYNGKSECLSMIKDAIVNKKSWRIEDFSELEKECEESPSFSAGDNKWKIQIYPKGKGSGRDTHLSLYLSLADPSSLSPTSKFYVEFTLRIMDQLYSKHYFGKANYWFSAANPVCGWPRFVSLSYFNLTNVGLLLKDTCVVEAEVTVHGITNAL